MLYLRKSQVLLLTIVQLHLVLSSNLVQQRHQEQQLQIQMMEFGRQLQHLSTELPNEQEVQGSGQEQELQIDEDLGQTSEVQEPQENQDEEKSQEIDDDLIKTYYFPDYNFTRFEESAAEFFTIVEPDTEIKTKIFETGMEEFDSSHLTSQSREKRASATNLGSWGPWTCCRNGYKAREPKAGGRNRFQAIKCNKKDDCLGKACDDDLFGDSCKKLKARGFCSSFAKGFMVLRCPKTCGWCKKVSSAQSKPARVTTTKTTPLPRRPAAATNGKLRRVSVNINENVSPPAYMFTMSKRAAPSPWKRASLSSRSGEVAAFHLYDKSSTKYSAPVYFCKSGANNGKKWMISKRTCRGGWKLDFRLYTSRVRKSSLDKVIYVSNRGKAPWTSRVTAGKPCCGYVAGKWPIYSPYVILARGSQGSATRRPPTTPYKPTNRPRPTAFTRPPSTKRPTPTTTRPSTGGGGPKSTFDRECLNLHNFFRALHNTPPLVWDSKLAATSSRWAKYLTKAIPMFSDQPKAGYKKTPNWPHSERGTTYRPKGSGENIAWQASSAEMSAETSVLRWYNEIFDYDKKRPTYSPPGRPVGHYTQLLWKDTTRVGCGRAVVTVEVKGYKYKSTYIVAHYAPGGNVRSWRSDQTLQFYSENVLDPKKGTCLTSSNCQAKGGCMGFKSSVGCGCARDATGGTKGRPRCIGSGGCMVTCQAPSTKISGYYRWKTECIGKKSCECVYKPVNGRAGAICQ